MEIVYNDGEQYLAHHGIKGQKWGVRRFQNEDGTLTEAGMRRYGISKANDKQTAVSYKKALNKLDKAIGYDIYRHDRASRKQKYALEKGKTEKAKKYEDEANFFRRAAGNRENEQHTLSGQATDKGYSVSSKKVTRDVALGRQLLNYELGGIIGAIALDAYEIKKYGMTGAGYVKGNKFKVEVLSEPLTIE